MSVACPVPAPNGRTYTFAGVLRALDRGHADELERLLQHFAWRFRVARDDVWAAASELWAHVDRAERCDVATWTRRVRAWLTRPETRSLLLGAAGLRRADVRRARAHGKTAHEARHDRLEKAWEGWQAAPDADGHRPPAREDVALRARLLEVLAAGQDDADVRVFVMDAAGADAEAIARTLGVADAGAVARGRAKVLARLGDNAAFALRRLLGEDNPDLEEASGLDGAAVRMRVTRGARELAALVAAAEAAGRRASA